MIAFFQNIFAPPRHLILLVLATWLGLALAEHRAERNSIRKEDLNNLTFYAIVAYILGGRISYILQNYFAFAKSPLSMFAMNPDLFDPLGAAVIAVLAAMIYGQRKQLPFWNALDALTPFFAILAAGIGLSHLAAGTAFGQRTDIPWGIHLWNATRHPTQIYETLASLLTFSLIWFLKPNSRPGILFLTFTAWTSLWQLFILAFRADETIIFWGLRQEQLLAWIVLASSFIFFEIRLKPSTKQVIHLE